MTTKFSLEEDECLLNLIKEHPEIYDKELRAHRDFSLKAIVWRNIAANLGRTEADCKARWKNVRDYYKKKRSEFIKEKGIASECLDSSFSTKFRNLSFLESIFQRQSLKNALNDGASNEEETDATYDLIVSNTENVHQRDNPLEQSMEPFCTIKEEYDSNTELVETDFSINSELEIKFKESSLGYENPQRKKRTKDSFEFRKRRKINNNLKNTVENNLANSHNSEKFTQVAPSISTFFESIAISVNELTPRLQVDAKMKILEIVSKLQIQDLCQKEKLSQSKFLQHENNGNIQHATDTSQKLLNSRLTDENELRNFASE